MSEDLTIREGKAGSMCYREFYRMGGNGDSEPDPNEEVVVLLHGLDSHSNTWLASKEGASHPGERELTKGAAPDLARQGYRVIIFDLPGHGKSDKLPDYEVETLGHELYKSLEELGLDKPEARVNLVSSCYGANVVLGYAKNYADHMRAAVLSDPVIGFRYIPKRRLVRLLMSMQRVLQHVPDSLNFIRLARGRQAKTEQKVGLDQQQADFTKNGHGYYLPNRDAFKMVRGLMNFEKRLKEGYLPEGVGQRMVIKYVTQRSYPMIPEKKLERAFPGMTAEFYPFECGHHVQMHPQWAEEMDNNLKKLGSGMEKYTNPEG
ncbi:MAG TPA: alpha/beta fold hydrolase [archaeon]|nr:alpha/beta fold hydrolase [archaeon]